MDTSQQNRTRITQIFLIVFSSLSLIGVFAATHNSGLPRIFDLRWNMYALLSLITIALNLVFLFIATRMNTRGSEIVWFSVFISAMTFFGAAEFFMRLSATPDGAIFWGKFLGIGALEAASSFLFVLHYLNPGGKYLRTTVFLLFGSIILFYFMSTGNLFINNNVSDIQLYAFGYYNDIAENFGLYYLWVLATTVPTLYLLLRFVRTSKSPVLKRQARLFMIAFLFPIVGSIVSDFLLPGFGIIIFPLHVLFGTATAAIVLWGLKRYSVFKISPALLSEEILTLMSESVVVVDDELKIQFVNQETEQMLKRAGGALSGQPLLDFLEGPSADTLMESLPKLKADKTLSLDNIIVKNDEGVRTYVRISASRATKENGIEGFILVITDVTELKNSYDALEQEKAGVEHTVEVRTKELREAQARLLETDKLKTEFVLLTSHNLRTPLAAIRGNVELLSMDDLAQKEKSGLLTDLQGSARKLGELIEDLLTISNIEAGDSLLMEDVGAAALLEPLANDAKQLAEATKNKLKVKIDVGDANLKANANRLRTAIRNLLDNACKFTKEGNVSFTATTDAHNLTVTVKDTGIGIPAEEIPKLFTKFHRATDAKQYDYDGEGIGLYLSKLIVEEHKGKIRLESELGKGSTFTVTIPLAPPTKTTPSSN